MAETFAAYPVQFHDEPDNVAWRVFRLNTPPDYEHGDDSNVFYCLTVEETAGLLATPHGDHYKVEDGWAIIA